MTNLMKQPVAKAKTIWNFAKTGLDFAAALLLVVSCAVTIPILTAILHTMPGSEHLLSNIGQGILGFILVVCFFGIGLPIFALYMMASDEYGDGGGCVRELTYMLLALAVILLCWATPTIPGPLGIVTGIAGQVHVCSFFVLILSSFLLALGGPKQDEAAKKAKPGWLAAYLAAYMVGLIPVSCAFIVISFIPLFLQGVYVFFSLFIQA